ncbi:nitric oxide synthase oxygenase [Halobacillus salinus]|uniref:Nitric oxide synthase oxygenase n=1 Tax=Halobacillus salinus TaxID=192814 RepID=A0A4Z0GVU2_9BACI|nr:nitric oxide synthase oxygenase [Halobacillus salinus]TGB01886.1 nitric oxide synthase [Halobacillus salinus]
MNTELYQEAESFIRQFYQEKGLSDVESRLNDVRAAIEDSGTYHHTYEELVYGAKVAWRNSNRCIGRLFWENLNVFDYRQLDEEEAIFQALLKHIDFATNGGRIRSTISIFRPKLNEKEVRIWNHQLVRYAGYETDDGVIGDPASVEFTKMCEALGWQGAGGSFDVLPLVIQIDDRAPKLFEIPSEKVLEVPLRHPEFDWFRDLELKWYAVPFISDMRLEIGGIEYTAAPFNGWYMGTEIGARNLADDFRYDLLPTVAKAMGLDTKRSASLWKDRALLELNQAVLHSYREDQVSIVDHHTAAEQFRLFEKKENNQNRQATGDWTWLIPPVSPAATHVFHSSYEDRMDSPNYFYQNEAYKKCPFH